MSIKIGVQNDKVILHVCCGRVSVITCQPTSLHTYATCFGDLRHTDKMLYCFITPSVIIVVRY